jgi:hypothetical protein
MPSGTVRVRMQFQKFVTCGHCACVYRVGQPRVLVGRGESTAAAELDAESAANREWSKVPKGPCPHCARIPSVSGLVSRVYPFALTGFFTTGALALPIAVAIAGKNPGVQAIALFASVVALLSCVICAGVIFYRKDRNERRNRERAQAAIDSGTVVIVQPGAEMLPAEHTPC